jgi:hypothetical protein
MTLTFAITESGIRAVQDLTDLTGNDLDAAIETHGAHSIEAADQHLILGFMRYHMGDFEGAEPHIWSHVTVSQQKCGPNSAELLTGLILLSINCIGEWHSIEQIPLVFDRLKFVSQRCHEESDPLLEGLYDAATRYQGAGDPASQQRSFILFLMELSWCMRHQSATRIYEQYYPRLKALFASYGFVEDRWEWLVKHSNHNLHDIVGLVSLLLDKRILPSCAEPPLTAERREEALAALVREFPVCVERDLRKRIAASGGQPVTLRFRCPRCGSWDLRTMFVEPYYPVSTLDGIEVNPGSVDLCVLNEREPSEFEGQGHTEGWQFWCDKCHLVPHLDMRDEEMGQEEALAGWLLDNCPQDDGLPDTGNSHSEG